MGLNGASAPNLRLPCVVETAYEHLGFAMLSGDPSQRPGDSLIAESRQISAHGVLEQCPVPVIAVADDGAVVFASAAFAHLLGCSCDALTCMSYEDICSLLPTDETLFAVTRLGPNGFVGSLMLSSQATVFVKMRKSATLSDADPDAVAMFEELTEHLAH
jgi:hypothetical protein